MGTARGCGCCTDVETVPAGATGEGAGGPVLVGACSDVGAGEDDGVIATTASRRRFGTGVGIVLYETVAGGSGAEEHEHYVACRVLDGYTVIAGVVDLEVRLVAADIGTVPCTHVSALAARSISPA